MSDTTFVSKITHILASWLNDVNKSVYRAIGAGGIAPVTAADVLTNIGLTPIGGAALIGNNTGGGSPGTTVQAALDLKANTSSLFTDPTRKANTWSDANSLGNAMQDLSYTVITNVSGSDRVGWQGVVNENSASNTSNFVGIVGHALHLGSWNGGAYWGLATEAWSTSGGYATLIGAEVSIIQQSPVNNNPGVGINTVFKNRSDIATNPTAPVANGSLYNYNSSSIFVSSQARPSGAGAAWAGVGSGWQCVLRVGDLVGGNSGLDWEGGSFFPGSGAIGETKAYTTVIDMTGALTDMAGSWPWHTLYKNAATFWGMRFNGMLTGQLDTENLRVNAGGAGYVVGDKGTITGGGGAGATYYVKACPGGIVTELAILNGASGYTVSAGLATVASLGVGAGLTIDLTIATGRFYGGSVGVSAGGGGYFVGELVSLDTGTAGYAKCTFKVTSVAAGVVTGIKMLSSALTYPYPSTARIYPNGRGQTVGVGKATTSKTGTGAGLQLVITAVFDDLLIGGERWEYWRMLNPGDPISSGVRHGFIDCSFPGTPLTIAAVPYTFAIDRPM